jgi:hypothetical protein
MSLVICQRRRLQQLGLDSPQPFDGFGDLRD